MKKWLCLLVAGIMLLSMTACGIKPDAVGENQTLQNEHEEQSSNQTTNAGVANKYNVDGDGNVLNLLDTIKIPYKSGANYEIYTDEAQMYYRYMVKDEYGYLLDEGYTDFRALDIYEKNGLLVLYRSGGSISYSERYYDISNGRISSFFWRPVAMSDKLVAFFMSDRDAQIKLIVQDIFDCSVYYTEIQRDFSDFVFKDNKYKGEFLDSNTKLKITYPVGDKGETVTETIPLPDGSTIEGYSTYDSFLEALKSEQKELYYDTRDIDGNGVKELLVKEGTKLTVYTLAESVTKVDAYDFYTGTVRLFYSHNTNYPGIFSFTVGGGANHYGYMTIQNGKIVPEKLWDEVYSLPADSADRVQEFSANKELIAESKGVYTQNLDIQFTKLGTQDTQQAKRGMEKD